MTPKQPMNHVHITILVDNNALPGRSLASEHGFSALVERGTMRILFDTGQGPALLHNAALLNIDLSGLDAVILSHGHYDHTGGLIHVVRVNPGIRVIAHPQALSPHFVRRSHEPKPREIGIPHKRGAFEQTGTHFHLTDEFEEVVPGVRFTGFVPRRFAAAMDGRLLRSTDSGFVSDNIPDDASLLLETPSGPVLMLGCAHAGVRNILEYIRDAASVNRIHAVIGGTHLAFSSREETDAVIDAFEEFGVQCIATAHCTGDGPNAVLKDHFGERFHHAWAGTVFEF